MRFCINLCRRVLGSFEQYRYPQVHEGLGEVDDCLAGVVDGHGGHGEVRALVDQLADYKKNRSMKVRHTVRIAVNTYSVPLSRLPVVDPVHVVGDGVQAEAEPVHVTDGLKKE